MSNSQKHKILSDASSCLARVIRELNDLISKTTVDADNSVSIDLKLLRLKQVLKDIEKVKLLEEEQSSQELRKIASPLKTENKQAESNLQDELAAFRCGPSKHSNHQTKAI